MASVATIGVAVRASNALLVRHFSSCDTSPRATRGSRTFPQPASVEVRSSRQRAWAMRRSLTSRWSPARVEERFRSRTSADTQDRGRAWKRCGWDSNPRNPNGLIGFQDQRLQPLGHRTRFMVGQTIGPRSTPENTAADSEPELVKRDRLYRRPSEVDTSEWKGLPRDRGGTEQAANCANR